MNQTNLNAELLGGDTRRKHIPMAVFAVILIHVVLFLVLLIAAGCRAKARARQNGMTPAVARAETAMTNAPVAREPVQPISQGRTEPVLAREPEMQRERVSTPGLERTAQRASPSRPRGDSATYTVKPGDTVGKIAKEHGVTIQSVREANQLKKDLIRPGQVLTISRARQVASL